MVIVYVLAYFDLIGQGDWLERVFVLIAWAAIYFYLVEKKIISKKDDD